MIADVQPRHLRAPDAGGEPAGVHAVGHAGDRAHPALRAGEGGPHHYLYYYYYLLLLLLTLFIHRSTSGGSSARTPSTPPSTSSGTRTGTTP